MRAQRDHVELKGQGLSKKMCHDDSLLIEWLVFVQKWVAVVWLKVCLKVWRG